MDWSTQKALVIGGGGFLGRYIVEQLQEKGCEYISTFGRNPQPELEKSGINVICGDLRNYDQIEQAVNNHTIVFLTAAKAGMWGSYEDYFGINVTGAHNVVDACMTTGTKHLIYTSSPSVAYSARLDIENMNENHPYPDSYLAHYPETKMLGEKLVLNANGNMLKTVALRPHLIWGVRDPHLVPRVVESARIGRLKIIGDGENVVDMTHVANAAAAHIQAAEVLADEVKCADVEGKAYFISDDNPVKIWDWTNSLLAELKIPVLTKKISYKKAFIVGAVIEKIYSIFKLKGEPPMTRFVAGQLAHSHFFDISAAKDDFGYAPIANPDQEFKRLVESMQK